MATQTESVHPIVKPAPHDWTHSLKSKWPITLDLYGSNLPCRLEGEIEDLVVLGQIPKEIDGSFYRIMVDPFMPPCEGNVPLDGDGNISVFQFHEGRVHMRTRYVETERYLLERKANKSLFGLYRNPFTHHPCVRAAVDSTANTNLVLWAGHLLALKEGALPYACDPHTLETRMYDPFGGQVNSKTFTAHPKYDPFKDELVVFGYEAKGLATTDVVSYTINRAGKIENELWFHQPYETPGAIHDAAITPNWLILFIWPFEASVERMKRRGHHWAWADDRNFTVIVVPRKADHPVAPGWKPNEVRSYHFKICMPIHTGAAWEEPDGRIMVESSRVHDNAFPFFPPDTDNPRMPSPETKADYVRWEIDPTKPDGSHLAEPHIVLDIPSEFPRIDERFLTQKTAITFLNVFIPDGSDGSKNIYHGLNGLAMHSNKTGETSFFYAGDESQIQEPIFIPRTDDAEEGDGWVMTLVERRGGVSRCDVVVIDTRAFERPVAIVQLPFSMKAQVHGNWLSAKALGGYRPITRQVPEVKVSGRGALEPL
ncbi:hypothetical protein M409DRAFT_70177 [Zasmidium cellare ATCC 36951]|uniref:Carotenoid oxygenase n=1 Tax=Zasmidium cellare ATCC 36951 TaxID=1080233 RepID=A0A6A6C4S7_ZASCE|nr:uncharacterized protein M409DRAFT_70177 [Zasmidium cellare ATCC 36951]KAF2160872.1 hypothetical protein M409DRAFT_70177 [Zasmidium cellare ATCC 36951]